LFKDIEIEQEIPIMETYFVLQIPNIIIIPTIEELQNYFSKVITNIIATSKNVITWGQRYPTNMQVEPLGNVENNTNKYLK
jgi:dynein heavy chain